MTKDPNELLKVSEAACLMKVSESYIYKLSQRGLLPTVELPVFAEPGKRPKTIRRFKYSDLTEFINQHLNQNI